MALPKPKPIRVPPTLIEEDREFLQVKRIVQNDTYQMCINFLDLMRKNQDNTKGEKCFRTSFNMAIKHMYPPELKQELVQAVVEKKEGAL